VLLGSTTAGVRAHVDGGILRLEVRGVGGARLDGHGLVGLGDRLAVLESRLRVDRSAAGGTRVAAEIPLRAASRR
jgi:signal transduction histidine kinase